MVTIPLLISAVVALGRYNYQNSTADTRALDPRSIVQAILVPKNFSTFGLHHRQKPARRTVVPMLFVRVVCGFVLVITMQGADCRVSTYACLCENSWIPDAPAVTCTAPLAYRLNRMSFAFQLTLHYGGRVGFPMYAQDILDDGCICCDHNLAENDLVFTNNISDGSGRWIIPGTCSVYKDLPAMLQQPCQRGALDSVRFRECRDSVHDFRLYGVCNGRFTICATFTDPMTPEKLRVVIYIFLPVCALCALLVAHILAQLLNCSLMDVEENRTLRQQVNRKARVYLEQLQNGSLEHSLLRLGIRCNPLCWK